MSLDPLILDETSPGTFSLLLRDLDLYSAVFEANGHSGNGYSWETVALAVVESSLAQIADQIEFDSEADMFCATSKDRPGLARLGQIVAGAARSPKMLRKLIATVPPHLWAD